MPAPCSRWRLRTPTQTHVASSLYWMVSPVLTNALNSVSSERDPASRSHSTSCKPLAEVRLSAVAVEDLDRMIVSHSLPPDTKNRFRRSLCILEQFPNIGRQLDGRWRPMRFILGPWRWMLIVYTFEESSNLVIVLTIQDARSSAAATAG